MIKIRTKRERLLTIVFVILAIIGLNYVVVSYLSEKHTKFKGASERSEQTYRTDKSWIDEEDIWLERKAFIDSHEFPLEKSSQVVLFNQLLTSSKNNGVKILEQSLIDDTVPPYKLIGVRMRATAPLKSMISWIHETHKPQEFISLNHFKCQPIENTNQVVCELEFMKWTKEGGSQQP